MRRNGRQRSIDAVKLFEHPDFGQAIIRAAEHFLAMGLRESIIEKDYFVTESLSVSMFTSRALKITPMPPEIGSLIRW